MGTLSSTLFLAVLVLAVAGHGGGHGHGHHDCNGGGHHGHHDGGRHHGGHGDGDCHHDGGAQNKKRACPDGYFYGGEIQQSSQRDMVVEKGETSPTYSCYSVHTWNDNLVNNWINATQRCSDEEGAAGQLLSVNNVGESQILTSDLFLTAAFGKDKNGSVNLPQTTFTSGISLSPGEWTWFGAGKEENSTVDELIGASIINNSTAMANGYTPCLAITFVKKPMGGNSSSEEHYVALEYAAVPCVNNITTTICEVRVYEQVWYVWFTTNWLQILFLLTLVLLLVSSCVTFQIWVSRPNRRPRGTIPRPSDAPPAYSVREDQSQTTKARLAAAAEKYTEKGKDIMAKVVYYRKPEDKQRLATDA